ncbi:MAG: YbgA family protein [Candidatus Binataceae bacterium]
MSSGQARPLWRDDAPLRVGISACLLGAEVRFDGGHKRNEFLIETLGRFVEFVPVCPEVDIGLGTPRESLRLERAAGAVKLIANKSKLDHTAAMTSYAARRTEALVREDLCGYVLKKDSPSCGMERVRIYGVSGMATRDGVGLYAAALLNRFPNLPVEEEGRLVDAHLRENFVERIFAYRRMRSFFATRWTIGALVKFHTAQKLALMAHSVPAYNELGRLVAESKALPREQVRERYETAFMQALRKIATPKRHANVLQHMLGYLRGHLDDASRAELARLIEDYRTGLVPLVVPLTLLRHHVRRFRIDYLEGQVYLEPHPKELMLRNHV